MIEGPAAGLAYIAGKFAAYALWCALGVQIFRAPGASPWPGGLRLGLLRLALGGVFGLTVFLAVSLLHVSGDQPVFLYWEIYAPLRLVEWSILAAVLQPGLGSFLVGPRRPGGLSRFPGFAWKLGGIAVSHVADLPLILGPNGVKEMLPIGRFLC